MSFNYITYNQYISYRDRIAAIYGQNLSVWHSNGVRTHVYGHKSLSSVFCVTHTSPLKLLTWYHLGLLESASVVDDHPLFFAVCVVRKLEPVHPHYQKFLTTLIGLEKTKSLFELKESARDFVISMFDPHYRVFFDFISAYEANSHLSYQRLIYDYKISNIMYDGTKLVPTDLFHEINAPIDFQQLGAKQFLESWV